MIKSYIYNKKTYYFIQLSYTDKKGKRHQPKFRVDQDGHRISSKRKAEILEVEYLMELRAKVEGEYSRLCFSEFHQEFLNQIKITYKRSTVMQYDGDLKKWLTPEFTKRKISEIKKCDIHNLIFIDLQKQGASSHTQKRILKSLRRIFEAALDEGIIGRNPAQGLKVKVPPPKKEVLNTKEANILLEKAKDFNHPFYYHWALALLTGMRNGELYALRWRDIDEVSNIIYISASWSNKDGYHSTKSNKCRIVPISDDLKKLILELRNLGAYEETLTGLNGNNQEFTDLVLPRSSEWKHGEQSKITKKFCEQIDITPVKFHDLRATFITQMLAQGVSTPKVMSIVGHSRMSTTDEYLRLAGVNVKGATENLGFSLPIISKTNIIDFKEIV